MSTLPIDEEKITQDGYKAYFDGYNKTDNPFCEKEDSRRRVRASLRLVKGITEMGL